MHPRRSADAGAAAIGSGRTRPWPRFGPPQHTLLMMATPRAVASSSVLSSASCPPLFHARRTRLHTRAKTRMGRSPPSPVV